MVAVVALAVGMVSFNFSDGTFATNQAESSAMTSGTSMLGHLEIIHQDSQGNILTYIQTDNAIMNEGRNCTAVSLFGTAANSACSADPGTYDVISLTNGTLVDNTHTDLPGELVNATEAGLGRSLSTVSQVATATGASADTADLQVSHTFVYTDADSQNILAAGLVNSTDSDTSSIFAAKNFGSAVTLNQNDQLTVNWDISISGTDVT